MKFKSISSVKLKKNLRQEHIATKQPKVNNNNKRKLKKLELD